MTTLEILRQRAPRLADVLATSDVDKLWHISSSIAQAVVDRSGLKDPLIAEALRHLSSPVRPQPELQARVQSLAEQLDAHYFDLQDGKASDDQVSAAFAKARAATAVAAALGGVSSSSAAETAYEAVCAINNSEEYFTGVAESVLKI